MTTLLEGLTNAETNYFRSLRVAVKYKIDVDKALEDNQKYYEKLFKLRNKTENEEEKEELKFELNDLCEQALLLKQIQLNQSGGTA